MTQETKIPANHVVGVVNGESAIDRAKQALKGAGFDEVLVMDRVDSTGEGVNPITSIIEKLAGHLSDQVGYIEQYKEQTDAGGTVLAVKVEDHDQAERVRSTMETFGAVNIRLFGRLAVSDLTPETNPSAPSDERPSTPGKTEASR
jgi:cyclopropane fatty-acyl-phospholipid synthase-like methyltransferase